MRILYLLLMFMFLKRVVAQSPETIHLHLNKQIFLPGETIFFKAYLYNNGQPSAISTNFYTALYDGTGKLITQQMYPVFDGSSVGSLIVPDSVTTRDVQLLAFTKGYQVQDTNAFFIQPLQVYNNALPLATPITKPNILQLQFVPEGGKVIEGISNHFYFTAYYSNGTPAKINGVIVEETSNTEIDSFATNNVGIGTLQFTPQFGKKYVALYKGEANQPLKTYLFETIVNGAVMHTQLSGNYIHYHVQKNTTNSNYSKLQLVITKGNMQLYTPALAMNDAMQAVNKIPVDSLATSGIVAMQLQDANGNIIQQQNIALPSKVQNNISINIQKEVSGKGKNNIQVQIADTLLYNLSVSVSDISFYNANQPLPTIHKNLWFSKANGFTQQAVNNTESIQHLFKTTVNNNANKLKQPLDSYLSLQANYKEKNYALPRNTQLDVVVTNKYLDNQIFKLQPIGSNSFSKDGLIFYDTATVSYQLDKEKELNQYITLNLQQHPKAPQQIAAAQSIVWGDGTNSNKQTSSINEALEDFKVYKPKTFNEVQTIKEVVVKAKKWGSPETRRLVELEDKYATGMFKGLARGFQYNFLDDDKASNMVDIFSYIAFRMPMLRSVGGLGFRRLASTTGGPSLVFINESLVDWDVLSSYTPESLAYVKFIDGIVITGPEVAQGGVLYVYTKKGDDMYKSNTPKILYKKFKGYDIAKEFINPNYADTENNKTPDLRSTLYWNPYVILDKNNPQFNIEFYNNDVSKKLLLIVEGINEHGELIHIERVIE